MALTTSGFAPSGPSACATRRGATTACSNGGSPRTRPRSRCNNPLAPLALQHPLLLQRPFRCLPLTFHRLSRPPDGDAVRSGLASPLSDLPGLLLPERHTPTGPPPPSSPSSPSSLLSPCLHVHGTREPRLSQSLSQRSTVSPPPCIHQSLSGPSRGARRPTRGSAEAARPNPLSAGWKITIVARP